MISEFERSDEKGFGYEIFIALISILSVFNLILVVFPGVNPNAVQVVEMINVFLTIIFIFDFLYRFTTVKSKSYYFIRDFGWADLLACAPTLRILRLFRVFKAYRLVKRHGSREIIDYLSNHRAESALYVLVFSVVLILELGSYMVLLAESTTPSANITTAGDALWWAYVTITTVGYGDKYPVTGAGRLVGVLVMTTGVAVFATFAGFISNKLLMPIKEPEIEETKNEGPDFEKQVIERFEQLKLTLLQQDRRNREILEEVEDLKRLIAQGKTVQPETTEEKPLEGPGPGEKYFKERKSKADYKSSFWNKSPRK